MTNDKPTTMHSFPKGWIHGYHLYCIHCGEQTVFAYRPIGHETRNIMACYSCGSRWIIKLHGKKYKTLPKVTQSYNGIGRAGGK